MAVRKSIRNAGLSLIVRKVYIMANGRRTNKATEPASKAGTSADLGKSPQVENTDGGALRSSQKTTTATMPKGSRKTWKIQELAELQSKIGLVAGALADFQTAKGRIVRDEVIYTAPSGRVCMGIKLILLVEDVDLVAVKTDDGVDFNLVAED